MNKPNFYIETISETKTEGTYVVTPLSRGMGYTIGNVLRRALLSELEGAAISHVKIKGVTHQFSTIKGLKEDVLSFLLNLKGVRFAFSGGETEKLVLKVKGAKKITAKDIADSSLCKVANPELYLGELAKGATLEVEIFVKRGVGYEPSEEKPAEYGVLNLDSIYSPVVNVAIKVESTRVERKTNFDKLTMVVKTDGSITGLTALKKVSGLLSEYFNLLASGGNQKVKPAKEDLLQPKKTTSEDDETTMMIDELDLPTRVINALIKHGIETVKDLSQMKDEDFTEIRGLGKKSIEELKEKLVEMKLK